MSNDLIVSTGAVTVPATALVEHVEVGDISRDTGPGNTAPIAESPQQVGILRIRSEMLRDIIIEGIGENEMERVLPVVQDYAPAMLAALKSSNHQEQVRLADGLRDEIISKGLLTLEQIERIRPILRRYNEQSQRAFNGPGANNSELIEEMRALDSLMANRQSRYYKGPEADGLQRRWRELYDQGVRGDGKRSTHDAGVLDRVSEIESLMGKSNSEYYRGPNADAIQQEYRDLIDRREHRRQSQ